MHILTPTKWLFVSQVSETYTMFLRVFKDKHVYIQTNLMVANFVCGTKINTFTRLPQINYVSIEPTSCF